MHWNFQLDKRNDIWPIKIYPQLSAKVLLWEPTLSRIPKLEWLLEKWAGKTVVTAVDSIMLKSCFVACTY